MSVGRKKKLILCTHCNTKHNVENYNLRHGDNCKFKTININRQHILEKINTYNETYNRFIDTFIECYNLRLAFLNKPLYTRIKSLGTNHKEMLRVMKDLKNISFELRRMMQEENKEKLKKGKTNGNN